MQRVIIELNSGRRIRRRAYLQAYDDNDNEVGSRSADTKFDLSTGEAKDSDAFTAMQAAINNPDDPAVVVFDQINVCYAGDPLSADPDSTTFPTLEPEPWMMVQNPFNPRATSWQVLTVDGWSNMPAVGSEHTLYDLREDGTHRHFLIWDVTDQQYKTDTGSSPEHADLRHELRVEPVAATAAVGPVVVTMDASIGATWNGWYVLIRPSTLARGTNHIGTAIDNGNTALTISVGDDRTWAQIVTILNNALPDASAPFNSMTVALAEGEDGSGVISGGIQENLIGGVSEVGGSFTIYQTTGTTAGQPQTPVKLTFGAPEVNEVTGGEIDLGTDRNTLVMDGTAVGTVQIHELTGEGDSGEDDAVWYDGVAGEPATGQPATFAFLLKLVHESGSTIRVLDQKRIRGESNDPNIVSQFLYSSEPKRVTLADGDQIYITIQAESDSTQDDPRSKSITITGGQVILKTYESQAALDIDDQINWYRTIYNSQTLQRRVEVYVDFDPPIRRSDFPILRSALRFDRAEADFKRGLTIDMSDYTPLADRAAAEALSPFDSGASRIVTSIFNNERGRLDLYRGSGFLGWDSETNLLAYVWQWFWGDSEYIRGMKTYYYHDIGSETNVWIFTRFER